MVSTKVLVHAVTAVVVNLVVWLAANQHVIVDNVPQPWGPLIATLIATIAAYMVAERNPAPSAVEAVKNSLPQ